MSQTNPSNSSTDGHRASTQALALTVVDGIAQRVVQPLESQLQAHDQRFNEFENCNTEFQNTVLTLLGSRGAPVPASSTHGRSSEQHMQLPHGYLTELLTWGVVRCILTTGCGIERLKHAKLGLTKEELQERIATDPPLRWCPDFLKSVNDPSNAFWIHKIMSGTMSDSKVLSLVASGKIAKEFWTEDCVLKRILVPMWSNVKKEVKKQVDDEAAARGKANLSKGNKDGRTKRLCNARLKLATGSDKCAKFQYNYGGGMRHIPPELIVNKAMSDVVDDEYDSDSIPAEVTRDEYRNARPLFEYEGRPPFFRSREASEFSSEIEPNV
ncbi:hypothetical protein BDV93DRAFT_514834 [Ceratobasidium sp. AG-I]|nr:hypothetical protein BDV93DRAFT_514834 [Ceratobasidium sp. AG-I]